MPPVLRREQVRHDGSENDDGDGTVRSQKTRVSRGLVVHIASPELRTKVHT